MKTSKCKKHGIFTEAEAYVCKNDKYKDGKMLRCIKCIDEAKMKKMRVGSYCKVHGDLNEENAYVCSENGRVRFRCKACAKVKRKEQYADNREQAIIDAAIWKKNNRDRVNAQIKQDKKDNPEKYKKWNNDYHERNRDKINIKAVARLHGLTVASYEAMIKAQGNVCGICGKEETRKLRGKVMRLCVDHNHSNGKIRSLLCHDCNSGLGKFLDSPGLLTRAAIYLSDWEEESK